MNDNDVLRKYIYVPKIFIHDQINVGEPLADDLIKKGSLLFLTILPQPQTDSF